MRDVSETLFEFADARRLLWNTFFRRSSVVGDASAFIEDFQEIDRMIFSSLVCRRLGLPLSHGTPNLGADAIERLRVVPRYEGGKPETLVSAGPSPHGGQWERHSAAFWRSDTRLAFVDFFDWDQESFITCGLCLARVVSGAKESMGRDVLLEVASVRILLEP